MPMEGSGWGPTNAACERAQRKRTHLEQLISANGQELLEQPSVAAVCLPDRERDIANNRDQADTCADRVVEQHPTQEPRRKSASNDDDGGTNLEPTRGGAGAIDVSGSFPNTHMTAHALCLPGLAKDKRVVEDGICSVANDGDETDDEGPAEAETADAEAFVEVMCAPLDRLEDLLVALGEAGWDLAL